MLNLEGKRYIVTGVANDKSIAWAIAQKLGSAGAYVQVLCQEAVLEKRVRPLTAAHGMPGPMVYEAKSKFVQNVVLNELGKQGAWDGIIHSIAFSDANELRGRFIDGSVENFLDTMHVSCYSLIQMAQWAEFLMPAGGSVVTLTFGASRGSYPHYNFMGLAKAALEAAVNYAATDLGAKNIRVNAISASPENTLAARGIGNFALVSGFAQAMSPMGRCATLEEIANEAAYLLSPMSSGVTGQTRYVDCGSSAPQMPPARNASLMAATMTKIAETHQKTAAPVAASTTTA